MKNTAFHYLNIQHGSTGTFKALEATVVAVAKKPVVWADVADDACGICVYADAYSVSCAWFVLRWPG